MPRTFVATVVFVTAMTTLVVCNIRLGIGIKFMNPVVRSVWFEPLVTADKPQVTTHRLQYILVMTTGLAI
jgi:hypothetical protein